MSRNTITSPIHYLHLQMRLEGIGFDDQNRLVQLELPGDDLPLVVCVRTSSDEQIIYVNPGLSSGMQQDLALAASTMTFPRITGIERLLLVNGISAKSGHYKTYLFPSEVARASSAGITVYHRQAPEVLAFGFGGLGEEVYAVERNGIILSACVSSLQNEACAESWVCTIPEERGKGLARKVVAAWAKAILSARLVPFYSHKIENSASARLASALGLIPVFEEIVIERADPAV